MPRVRVFAIVAGGDPEKLCARIKDKCVTHWMLVFERRGYTHREIVLDVGEVLSPIDMAIAPRACRRSVRRERMNRMPVAQQHVPIMMYDYEESILLGAHAHLDDLGNITATMQDLDAYTKQYWKTHKTSSHSSYDFVNDALQHFHFVPQLFALRHTK